MACLDHADIAGQPGSCGVRRRPASGSDGTGRRAVGAEPAALRRLPRRPGGHRGLPGRRLVPHRRPGRGGRDGYLSIVGRTGDSIRTGGESVAPTEVEARRWPATPTWPTWPWLVCPTHVGRSRLCRGRARAGAPGPDPRRPAGPLRGPAGRLQASAGCGWWRPAPHGYRPGPAPAPGRAPGEGLTFAKHCSLFIRSLFCGTAAAHHRDRGAGGPAGRGRRGPGRRPRGPGGPGLRQLRGDDARRSHRGHRGGGRRTGRVAADRRVRRGRPSSCTTSTPPRCVDRLAPDGVGLRQHRRWSHGADRSPPARVVEVAATDLAVTVGGIMTASMVMVGAYGAATGSGRPRLAARPRRGHRSPPTGPGTPSSTTWPCGPASPRWTAWTFPAVAPSAADARSSPSPTVRPGAPWSSTSTPARDATSASTAARRACS